MQTLSMWFCLGDSLTLGGTGFPGAAIPWPTQVHSGLAPSKGCANQGKSGDTVGNMQTRYTSNLKNRGFVGAVVMGGINDLNTGGVGSAILTTFTALVNEMLADGLKVIAVSTSPFSSYSAWNSTKQGYLETLNNGIMALTGAGLTLFDGYAYHGEPGQPTKLRTGDDFGDGLHWSAQGQDRHAAAILPLIQAA